MLRTFKKEFESLEAVFHFAKEFFDQQGLEPEALFPVYLALEEYFTNMVKYNASSRQDVALDLKKEGDYLVASLSDRDVEPFDVTRVGDVPVDQPLEQRRAGGLGLYLARQMVDRVDYHYADRTSTVTIYKKIR